MPKTAGMNSGQFLSHNPTRSPGFTPAWFRRKAAARAVSSESSRYEYSRTPQNSAILFRCRSTGMPQMPLPDSWMADTNAVPLSAANSKKRNVLFHAVRRAGHAAFVHVRRSALRALILHRAGTIVRERRSGVDNGAVFLQGPAVVSAPKPFSAVNRSFFCRYSSGKSLQFFLRRHADANSPRAASCQSLLAIVAGFQRYPRTSPA